MSVSFLILFNSKSIWFFFTFVKVWTIEWLLFFGELGVFIYKASHGKIGDELHLFKTLASDRTLPSSDPDWVWYVFSVESVTIWYDNRVCHVFQADGAFKRAVEVTLEKSVELLLSMFHNCQFFYGGFVGRFFGMKFWCLFIIWVILVIFWVILPILIGRLHLISTKKYQLKLILSKQIISAI
jgi:hypothetical protein